MTGKGSFRWACALVLGLGLCAERAPAADSNWIGSTGDWSDGNNWSGGVPDPSINPTISNGGTAVITQAGLTAGGMRLGSAVGESGTVRIVSGTLYSDSDQFIGGSGSGTIVQTGGDLSLGWTGVFPVMSGARLYLANNAGSYGEYHMEGPGQLTAWVEYVGQWGTGWFTQSDGTNRMQSLWLANVLGSSGTYELSGTGHLIADNEDIARLGLGTFTQTGGINSALAYMVVGDRGEGRYEITDGNLDVGGSTTYPDGGGFLHVGNAKKGTFIMSGGRVTLRGGLVVGDYTLTSTGGSGSKITLSGGVVTVKGVHVDSWSDPVAMGRGTEIELGNGVLRHEDSNFYLDIGNSGLLHVTAGSHTFGRIRSMRSSTVYLGTVQVDSGASLSVSSIQGQTLNILGTLTVGEFYVGQSGSECLTITDANSSITVSGVLSIGAGGQVSAVPGSVIRMTGSEFRNGSADANGLAGLANVRMIFEGGDANTDPFEVAGRDCGAVGNGFLSNFGLGTLELGGAGGIGRVGLMDLFDNTTDSNAPEALYVQGLIVNPGSELLLNGLHLYVNGALVNAGDGSLYGGGTISAGIPEPGAVFVLAAGGLAILRLRRRRL